MEQAGLKWRMSKFAFRNDPQKRKQRLEALYLASKQNQQVNNPSPVTKGKIPAPVEQPSS
jgi:hypothetical protein